MKAVVMSVKMLRCSYRTLVLVAGDTNVDLRHAVSA